MSIKLDNFIKITITPHITNSINSSRDTTVFLVGSTLNSLASKYYALNSKGLGDGTSKDNAAAAVDGNGSYLNKYFEIYFENGGQYLHVLSSTSNLPTTLDAFDRDEIVIVLDNETELTTISTLLQANKEASVYKKIFIKSILSSEELASQQSNDGLVYKIEPELSSNEEYQGTSAMAVAAYYSKIRVYDTNAAKDYAFTSETLPNEMTIDDDDIVSQCIENHLNCNVVIANTIRNIGGDDSKGNELTNLFMQIVLQQTLTDRLMNLLVSKIKYDSTGITAVNACITNELNRYVASGYISTNKTWTDNDLYVDNELIIAQDTPLQGGYKLHISPYSSLTTEQLEAHQFPNIYLIYSDSYSIRKIVITGEVF